MFYIANAVMYKMGYKVGHKIAHKVSSDALIYYIRDKLKKSLLENYEEAKEESLELAGLRTDELLQSFDYERMKRSKFQYDTTDVIKKSKAKTSFERAKEFGFEMEKLLQKIK
jgi:mannose/fructose/N-acetylgalactosamine-specific phosphotransferase system component IID